MAKKFKSPLNAEHLERLNKVLESCAETKEYLEKCVDCGLDVDQEQVANAQQEAIAQAIKRNFFPNQP